MADGYTDVFGGRNRSPAQLSYAAYVMNADLELVWPFEANAGQSIATAKIDIAAMVPGLRLFMPNADVVTVGEDTLIRNIGSQPFTVVDALGNTIVTITSGIQWFLWITDNSTPQGVWATTQFGASTSSANAAALAGAGLRAAVTRLDQDLLTTPLIGNHAVSVNDRATVLQNNGGAAIYSFGTPGSYGNGFFTYVINAGSGTLQLTVAAGTIDGVATKNLAPGENAIIFCDGSNFHSLGYGRLIVTSVSGTTINAAPGGTITLNSPQVQAQVQDVTGLLPNDTILEYGPGVGFWFVQNATTGAHTLTARVNGLDAGVVIAQGTFSILRSNGTNMKVAFSGAVGTVTSVATTAGELTGGTITVAGTLGLADTAVVPGTYGDGSHYPIVTIDQKGRATAASSSAPLGSAAFLPAGSAPGNVALLDANGLVSTVNGGVPIGVPLPFIGLTPPPGYVLCFGTIGNAISGATNRANADTLNLFTLLWNSWANALAPVSGGRGGSAATDFAANKTIAIPDLRGCVIAGLDNMGGLNRGLLGPGMGGSTIPGVIGGIATEAATLSGTGSGTGNAAGTIFVTSFSMDQPDVIFSIAQGGGSAADVPASIHTHANVLSTSGPISLAVNVSVSITGTTAVVSNVQPTMVMNYILKL
jgi:microcystin-dependent protein